MNERKLAIGQGVAILAIVFCVGGLGFWVMQPAKQRAALFRDDTLRKLVLSAELNSYQAEGYARLLLMIDTDDPVRRQTYHTEGHAYRAKIDELLAEYEKALIPDKVQERRVFDNFTEKRRLYREIARQIIGLLDQSKKEEAQKLAHNELTLAYRQYTAAGDDLLKHDVATGKQRADEIEAACTRTQWLAGLIYVATLIVGFATPVVYTLTRNHDDFR